MLAHPRGTEPSVIQQSLLGRCTEAPQGDSLESSDGGVAQTEDGKGAHPGGLCRQAGGPQAGRQACFCTAGCRAAGS